MSTVILASFLAYVVGFTVRRAGICLVRATAEIVARKPARTMIFVVDAMSVASLITIPAMLFFPNSVVTAASFVLTPWIITGALVYGIGIAVNNGCALGTMNALSGGKLSYGATIGGFLLGYLLTVNLPVSLPIPAQSYLTPNNPIASGVLILLLIVVIIIVGFRGSRAVHSGSAPQVAVRHFLSSTVSRDSIAIFTLGTASGLLYLIGGSWDYTSWMMHSMQGSNSGGPPALMSATAFMLIAGIVTATLLAGSFKYDAGHWRDYAVKFIGGLLMALGAAMIPGGNDTIILYSLPGLALHAVPALAMIVLGVLVVITIKKMLGNRGLLGFEANPQATTD